jgi:predicted PurR-regulated permease PerM
MACPKWARMHGVRIPFIDHRKRHGGAETPAPTEDAPAAGARTVVEIDATFLSRVFSAPIWLRDLGLLAWFLVGVALVLVGAVWLLGITSTIVNPVVLGAVVAAVAGPIVGKLQRHGVPRAAGAAIVFLSLAALGVLIFALVARGIVAESDQIKEAASKAVDRVEGWLNDAGADGTSSSSSEIKQSVPEIGSTLLTGVADGIKGMTSFIFFLTFTAFSTFFLLKDGPGIRSWIDGSLGVPRPVATTITGNVILSLRRYFTGVSIVAAFNAVVVGVGALILDVPLAGTIAVVTFVTAYIPFIGAVISGALAVVLALSSQGTTTALIMLVVVILANGLLQNIVQPIAFGATLDLNPLVVLIASISGGALFGMVGLVLAAPLTSAAVHISRELAAAKAAEAERGPPGPGPDPVPDPFPAG